MKVLLVLFFTSLLLQAQEYKNLLNTDPTKLVVIDKGKIFYNGEELVLNGECPIEQWKSVLGSFVQGYVGNSTMGWSEGYKWPELYLSLTCSWTREKKLQKQYMHSSAFLGLRGGDSPSYKGFIVFDGVEITKNTSFDHCKKYRNHKQHFYFDKEDKALDKNQHFNVRRMYKICTSVPTKTTIYWEGNKNNKDYRKLTALFIKDNVSNKRCTDNPFTHFESATCDKECAEKKGRAAMALVSAMAPHSSAIELPQQDEPVKQESDSSINRWISKAKSWAGIKDKPKPVSAPNRSQQLQALYKNIIQETELNEQQKMKKLYKEFLEIKVP